MIQKIRGQFTKGTKVNKQAGPSMPRRKTLGRAMGLIPLDIFRTTIPVYLTDIDRCLDLQARGFPAESFNDGAFYGLACFNTDGNGNTIYSMIIASHAREDTISHECSHITDFLFDDFGIPPGMESTEIRAYLTSYLIGRTETIVAQNQERYPNFYEKTT